VVWKRVLMTLGVVLIVPVIGLLVCVWPLHWLAGQFVEGTLLRLWDWWLVAVLVVGSLRAGLECWRMESARDRRQAEWARVLNRS
jgi:hypothetical protein